MPVQVVLCRLRLQLTGELMAAQLSEQELRRLTGGKPLPAKYRNKKVKGFDAQGRTITFDSKREARRWGELVALQRAGEIRDLERQPVYRFFIDANALTYKSNRVVRYVADFRYVLATNDEVVVEDSKGFSTPDYKLKWALMRLFHGIDVREV